MGTDPRYYYGETRGARHEYVATADASVLGVEVLPAPAVLGAVLYIQGFAFHNESGGALTISLASDAGNAGAAVIGAPYAVANGATLTVHFMVPLVGVEALNVGVIASGAGKIQVQIWGYQAAV